MDNNTQVINTEVPATTEGSVVQAERPKNEMFWQGEHLIVKTRTGKSYKFEEQIESVLKQARESSTMTKIERGQPIKELNEDLMMTKMVVKSCVEPQLKESEFDFGQLKGSEALLLRKAISDLYDLDAFL